MALNLEKQLVFYGQYHHDPTNIAIHITCVPLILFTGFLLGTNSPELWHVPDWLSIPYLPANLGTIFAFLYTTLYILLEPVAGAMVAPIILGSAACSNYLTSTYGATANLYAIAIHIACWITQFIGHGKFEGRAPALLDNLVQAIFLAPFFVWFEVLFALGYRPELKRRLDKAVEIEVMKYKKSKETNGAAANGKTK